MINYTYNFEIMTLVEQFVSAFNDIIVKTYDKDKNLVESVPDKSVRFLYSPKQRVFNNLTTPAAGGITLPAIAVSVSKISRDEGRVFNKNDGFLIPYENLQIQDSRVLKKIPQPLPVNVDINMTIFAKFQQDMDQIITNFVPYFDPYIVLSWKFPGSKENNQQPYELRSHVIWNQNISYSYPDSLNAAQVFRLSADTSFTIKGWLFKKMDENIKKIYFIDADLMASRKASLLEQVPDTSRISLSAIPVIKNTNTYSIFPSVSSEDIDLYGKYFFDITNLYLSASNVSAFSNSSLFAPFSSLSAQNIKYPPFTGVEISNFTQTGDNLISFKLPSYPSSSTRIDVIAVNESGYGKLTEGSKRISYSQDWIPIPPPSVSGIEIYSE